MLDVVHKALPMDGRAWRVEWVGNVRLNPFSPKELEILVAFRQMGPPPEPKPTMQIKDIWIGVGALCHLPLGSMWRNGRYIGRHPATELSCSVSLQASDDRKADWVSYEIAASTRKHTKDNFGSYIIPRGMGHGYLMRIRIASPKTRLRDLYIPLFEIARSWFLRDSELTLRLLSGPIEAAVEELYDPARLTATSDGKLLLPIRPGLSEAAVPIIAMLITDPYARLVAGRMINEVVKAYMTKRFAGLETLPPLQGQWQIEGVGEWGEKHKKNSFYLHRMTAIQLPALPPIEWFRADGDLPADGVVQGDDGSPEYAPYERDRKARVHLGHHFDPSTRMGKTSQAIETTGIINPPSINRRRDPPELPRTRKRDRPDKTAIRERELEASTGAGISSGEGLSSFRFKSVNEEAEEQPSKVFLPAGLENMVAIARELRTDRALKIRAVGGAKALPEEAGIVRTPMTDRYAWSFIDGKLRIALCYEVTYRTRHFYLLEIERRFEKEELSTCLATKVTGRRFSPADVDLLLEECASVRGSWKIIRDPYWRRTLAHKFKDVQTFVRRVKKLMDMRADAMDAEEAVARS